MQYDVKANICNGSQSMHTTCLIFLHQHDMPKNTDVDDTIGTDKMVQFLGDFNWL